MDRESYWNAGIDLLAAGNYITVNRSLIKAFGLEGAVLIGELASEAKYWNDRNMLENGWFYSTVENVEDAIGLSGYQQRKAIASLTDAGVVEVKQKGIPKKRHIRINFVSLLKLLENKSSKNFTTSSEETSQQEDEKLSINKKQEQHLTTTSEKIKEEIPFSEIIDHLNAKSGKRYRATTRKTRDLIKARFNEGFTLEDFKRVIDVMSAKWRRDDKMDRYLRPETLFGPKFESYLNEEPPKGPTVNDLAYEYRAETWKHSTVRPVTY